MNQLKQHLIEFLVDLAWFFGGVFLLILIAAFIFALLIHLRALNL